MSSFWNNFTNYISGIIQGLRHLRSLRLSSLGKVFSFLSKREKIALLILVVLALANLYLSLHHFYIVHTVAVPGQGGIYVEGMTGQPEYINPLLASSDADLSLEKLIFAGLYGYDNTGQLTPNLAEGFPQISEDQKQYTIDLKKNLTWHNGRPLTADDVVFTIQLLQDPNYKSPLRNLWLSTTVERLSDTSIKFTTKDISGPFIYNLTLPILPKNVWQAVTPQTFLTSVRNLQAIGSGPYVVKEIQKERSGKVDQISLGSFSGYFGGKPKLDNIIIKFYDADADMLNALHSKEIQGLGFTATDSSLHIDSSADVKLLTVPLPEYQVLFYNLSNKILAELPVRQALSQAINRQGVIDDIFKESARLPGNPFTFGPSHIPGPSLSYNIEQAASDLEAAGWKLDKTTNLRAKKGQALKFNLATNDSLLNSKTAEAIANTWKTLGAQVTLTVLPTQDLTNNTIRPRTFDALIFPIKLGADPDPFAFWQSSQTKDPGLNLTGFSDANADKLITQARSSTDQQKREDLYEQFGQLLSQKIPAVFLNQSQYQYAVDPNIKNVNFDLLYSPADRFSEVANWYVQEQRVWK